MATHYLDSTWYNIKQRCYNKKCLAYKNYGGRGISMYQPWIDSRYEFAGWIIIVLGPRPDGYSLDRIDNDGNYEPGNLRWATRKQQANNKRPVTNRDTSYLAKIQYKPTVIYKGQRITMDECAKYLGVRPKVLSHIRNGRTKNRFDIEFIY